MSWTGSRLGAPRAQGAPGGHTDIGIHVRLLYRVEEAAEILALGRSTVYELLATGQLKSIKVGRACRITASELDRFVEELGS